MSTGRHPSMLARTGKFRLSAAFLAMAVSACGGESGSDAPAVPGTGMMAETPTPTANSPENTEGVELTAPLLAAACTLTATTMNVAVADGETAYLQLRASDSKVVLNALTAAMAPCELASGVVTITAAGTTAATGRTVILDYINGLFLKGAGTPNVPGVVIDMTVTTNGTADSLKVRGLSGDDSFAVGAGTGGVAVLNINAGSTTGLDSAVDVTFKQVENVIINGGDGNDKINAAGVFGATPVWNQPVKFYGGAGNDTITGGSQADTLYGGSNDDTVEGGLGADIYNGGTAADGADTFTSAGGADTIDYSGRTAALTIKTILPAGIAASSDTSGGTAGAEGDKISDAIINIKGGEGVDTIVIASTSTVAHVVTGGKGNDHFTGGAGPDIFDGGLGGDTCIGTTSTMSYATRTAPTTITLCGGDDAACSSDNNDGAPQSMGTGAASTNMGTTTDDRINVTGLSGMVGSEGRLLRLTGYTGVTANDDGTTGYPVVSVTSATAVVIDVSGNSSFDETDLAATSGLAWTLVAEGDNARCANVTGGTVVDTITGDARNNIIKGGAGADVFTGGAGDDTLHGEADGDTLYGGVGSDTLVGGDGIDNLYGGDGDDIMQGDAGDDNFYCDGLNASGSAGTDPGPIDFLVDLAASGDTSDATCTN